MTEVGPEVVASLAAGETTEDRNITPEVPAERLRLVADVARSVWG